jgi:hypothetical protein
MSARWLVLRRAVLRMDTGPSEMERIRSYAAGV